MIIAEGRLTNHSHIFFLFSEIMQTICQEDDSVTLCYKSLVFSLYQFISVDLQSQDSDYKSYDSIH